ncbi:tetratricopeptide repeat protein [Crenothrix polyspora]|uniref:NodB homology domain-containing protein n=1 Tax=Crenothrix polyspora TaxID=360316 RepID=A0A1R4H1U1_9GAMM|nr:tetratricopeptide repeat protein [Crenothrix polyspora]SJM90224.1 hypothetical protein CRENPOLYSF1_1390017 [Crenothrix polyspora]
MSTVSPLKSRWLFGNLAGQCAIGSLALLPVCTVSADDTSSLDAVLKRANTFYSEKKFENARQEFEQALKIDSGSLSAWRSLGWSYWALGRKDRAYKIWADLIEAFPDDVPTLVAFGKANEQDHHLKAAMDYYARVLARDPQHKEARRGITRVRLFQTRTKIMLIRPSFHVTNTALPDKNTVLMRVDALMKQGHYKVAVNMLRREARTPYTLRRLGSALANLGEYEQAASIYKASLGIQNNGATLSAWRGLGASLRKLGQHQRAYDIWLGLLLNSPHDVPTLLAMGRASEQDGLSQQGLYYYARVLRNAPSDENAHLGRARIFAVQKDYNAAEIEIKSALNHWPSDNLELALAENLVAMGRHEEAENILQPLVRREQNVKNLQLLGSVLAKMGKNDEAVSYFEKSLRLDANNAKSVMGLARVYWDQHRYNEGIALLQPFLSHSPENDVARARFAEHASAAGHWEQAERELRFLMVKHPGDSQWKVKLARQLMTSGHYNEAVQLAEKVVAKNPSQVSALSLLASNAIFSGDIEEGIQWTKRITDIKPTAEKLNQLGKLHIERGAQLETAGKHEKAMRHYAAASAEFQHASALDPIKSRAPIGMVEALRLQKRYGEAQQLAENLHTHYPNSVDVLQQLADINSEKEDYTAARKWLELKQVLMPGNTHVQKKLAKAIFYSGEQSRGLQMLRQLVDDASHSPSIPVLLYHGITTSEREDTMPLKKFREQLLTLKKAGYQTITLAQLQNFLEGNEQLPAKPILITFDDARVDSFQYADPILAETGFRAAMFVPVGDVATHGAYTVIWPALRKMAETGRWDMQCHGTEAQHYIPVNTEGHKGRFMANRQWLAEAHRLEDRAEFTARIDHDLQNCQETLSRELAQANIFAFAYPYSDQGHRSLSNDARVFSQNQEIVNKRFQLAFHVDNDYLVTRHSPRFSLPRFEVPRTFSGDDLIHQLKTIDPKISASYDLAHLEMEAGNYSQAMTIFNQLERDGAVAPSAKAAFLTTTGKILKLSDDHAGARTRFERALALSPNDPAIQMGIAALNRRLKPSMQLSGQYFEDNAHRSYYGVSPSVHVPVSDKLTLSAYYTYFDFNQTLSAASGGALAGEQQFQTHVNQFEAQLRYELGARTILSVSAGAADYSDNSASSPVKSGSIFALGSIKLTSIIADKLDVSLTADHTYVNTAGAILNDIAFSRVQAGFGLKLMDSLKLSASHAYSYYTDDNRSNRTEVQFTSRVWNEPDITIGAQLIYADTLKENRLFWTPNNYFGFALPLSLKKKWGQSVTTEIAVAPGMGKEAGNDFRFQINSTANINWNVNDNFSVYLSANRYEAASYSNFGVTAGISLRY